MKAYLATYGNGTRRIFDATSTDEATRIAFSYGRRHRCGALLVIRETRA